MDHAGAQVGEAATVCDRGLTADEKALLAPYIHAVDLDEAVLHEGQVPWYLSRKFVAIVRGRHVYLRPGIYVPGSVEGLALLGHELTHVAQYRQGMTALRYLWHSLRGYRNNPYERAAFAVQARIRFGLTAHYAAVATRKT